MIDPNVPEVGPEGVGLEWRVVARQWVGPGQMQWSYMLDSKEFGKDFEAGRVVKITGPMAGGYQLYGRIAKAYRPIAPGGKR